jgi:chromosome segregation ATPase
MKVKPEIKEKIITTANALTAEGIENPTNDQVRERMGGGSLSHISPVMREWRESRKAEVVAALEIPADLKKVIETSVGQVWTAASKLASATVETVRQEADIAIDAATDERDEALTEISNLEERIAELQKALSDKDQIINQIQGELDKERTQSAKLASDNSALTAQVDDRDEQIKGLKDELKEARNDNKALQGELVEIARKASEKK